MSFLNCFFVPLAHWDALFCPSLTAYLDGGSGSMVMQAAISGLLAVALVYRTAWAKIKGLFDRGRRD